MHYNFANTEVIFPFRFRFRDLQPGDAVTVDDGTPLCHHVAIYLGNDEVIEFRNELRRTTWTEFIDGAQSVSRVRYTSLQPSFKPEEIADRAKAALKNPEKVGSYDVISNNSEHFVTDCAFGKRLSYQRIMAEKATASIEANQMECTPSTDSVKSSCGKDRLAPGSDRPAPGSDMGVTRPATCSVKLEPISHLR